MGDPHPEMVKAVWQRLGGGDKPVDCHMVGRAMRAAGYDISDDTVVYWHKLGYKVQHKSPKPDSPRTLTKIRKAAATLSVPGAFQALELNVGVLTQNPKIGINDLIPPRPRPVEEIIVGPLATEEDRSRLEKLSDAMLAREEARQLKVTSVLLLREAAQRKAQLLGQDPAALGEFLKACSAAAVAGTAALERSYAVLENIAPAQIEHKSAIVADDDPLKDELSSWADKAAAGEA
jgi:hypothetical protein